MSVPFFDSIDYFQTPIWHGNFSSYLQASIQATDTYVDEAKKNIAADLKYRNKKLKKKIGDFGISHHSTTLINEPALQPLIQFFIQASGDFLGQCGFDLKDQKPFLSECWVQEFGAKGGGWHDSHVHYNSHVSGFYFLKVGKYSSYPVFTDPRPGALMTKLPLKDFTKSNSASAQIHYKPNPGDLIIFPAYLTHGFPVDLGVEPFRFIHFNLQFVPKDLFFKPQESSLTINDNFNTKQR